MAFREKKINRDFKKGITAEDARQKRVDLSVKLREVRR